MQSIKNQRLRFRDACTIINLQHQLQQVPIVSKADILPSCEALNVKAYGIAIRNYIVIIYDHEHLHQFQTGIFIASRRRQTASRIYGFI